jgi:hypothetical protein
VVDGICDQDHREDAMQIRSYGFTTTQTYQFHPPRVREAERETRDCKAAERDQ